MRAMIISGFEGFGKGLKEQIASQLELDVINLNGLFSLDASNYEKTLEEFGAIEAKVNKAGEKSPDQKTSWVFLNDDLHSPTANNVLRLIEEKGLKDSSMLVCGISLPGARAAVRFNQDVDTLEELARTIEAENKAGFQIVFP